MVDALQSGSGKLAAHDSRYALYLLYWYKSTSTDVLLQSDAALRSATWLAPRISVCSRMLTYAHVCTAERCCAALGDMARAAYLRKVIDVAQTAEAEGLQDGTSHFLVRAKMSTLQKHFDRAEQILLEQGAIDQAMEMYQELHRYLKRR